MDMAMAMHGHAMAPGHSYGIWTYLNIGEILRRWSSLQGQDMPGQNVWIDWTKIGNQDPLIRRVLHHRLHLNLSDLVPQLFSPCSSPADLGWPISKFMDMVGTIICVIGRTVLGECSWINAVNVVLHARITSNKCRSCDHWMGFGDGTGCSAVQMSILNNRLYSKYTKLGIYGIYGNYDYDFYDYDFG